MMKRKSLLVILLAVVLSFLQIGFTAEPVSAILIEGEVFVSGDYQYQIKNDAAVIISYSGKDEVLRVPDELGGYPVAEIGYGAFKGCTSLKVVELPDSIETIDSWAFQYLQIEKITLPKSLKIIGFGAFWGCESLKEVDLPDALEIIGKDGFYGSGIEMLVLPANVKEIRSGAFENCQNLREFIFSDNYPVVNMTALFTDSSQLKKIVLGKNTQMIIPPNYSDYHDKDANFEYDMPRVEEIVIPDENPYLKNEDHVIYTKDGKTLVYYMLNNTEAQFTVPKSVQTIGARAFAGNYSLESVQLPASVSKIEPAAFCGCKNLTSIAIPDSVRTIPYACFQYCKSLKRVNLPPTVKSVEENGFGRSLKVLTVGGKNTRFEKKAVYKSTTIVCEKGSQAAKCKAKINARGKHVIYHLGGGVNHADNVYCFTKSFTLKAPTRPGYTFAGWYTDAAKTKQITRVAAGKDYVLYAKWERQAS